MTLARMPIQRQNTQYNIQAGCRRDAVTMMPMIFGRIQAQFCRDEEQQHDNGLLQMNAYCFSASKATKYRVRRPRIANIMAL